MEWGRRLGVSMAIETTPSTPANAAVQQGWVFVLMEEKRLRQLLLTVLSQAGYVLLGCASLAEAEPIRRQRSRSARTASPHRAPVTFGNTVQGHRLLIGASPPASSTTPRR